MAKSQLQRKKVQVRSKRGKTYLRSVMVRAQDLKKKHGRTALKIAGGAVGALAVAGGAYLAHKHGAAISTNAHKFRRGVGAKLGQHLIREGGSKIIEKLAEHHGGAIGEHIGGVFGEHGAMVGRVLGEHAANFLGQHYAAPHLNNAAVAVGMRMRKKHLFEPHNP